MHTALPVLCQRNQGHTRPPAQSDHYRVKSVHVHQTRCCSALSPPSLYPTALSKWGLFRMPVTLNQIHHAIGIFLSYSCSEGGLPPRVSGPIIQAAALCGPQRHMHTRLRSWSISVLLSFHTSMAERDRSPSQGLIRSRLSSVRQALRRQAGLHDLPAPESHSLTSQHALPPLCPVYPEREGMLLSSTWWVPAVWY